MNEIWKVIPGYENYEVSNLGRVRSIDRTIKHAKYGLQKRKGKILYQSVDRGYCYVKLCKENSEKIVRVSVLVYEVFIGERKIGHVVDHIDNNRRLDNSVSNLQLLTNRQNVTKDSKLKLTGAYKRRNKWYSRIQIDGQDLYLGTFNTEIEAHEAYLNKLKQIEHN
jgi:hypothetical protein